MKRTILLFALLMLSACATWADMSKGQKTAVVIGAVVVTGAVIAGGGYSSGGKNKDCEIDCEY